MATIQGPVADGVDPVWLARQLARFEPHHGIEAVAMIRAFERADREKAAREFGN
ncbi:hypothetical protein [Nocardia aurea]|uniref:hypothetical protein n=1 Tax=Nocardia aurea TaxID=2144174 RepID=UPI0033B2F0F1